MRGVKDTHPTKRIYHTFNPFSALLLQTGLETGPHPAGGRHSGARKTDCNRGLAHHGSEPGETLSELSSSVEPGGVVAPGAECGLDGLAGEHLFAHWASGDRDG